MFKPVKVFVTCGNHSYDTTVFDWPKEHPYGEEAYPFLP